MPFVKGQSGNPAGRPKLEHDVAKLAKQHGPAAIRRLAEWMESDNAKASVQAAQALLDRGFGKALQTVEHSGAVTMRRADEMADDELAAVLEDRYEGAPSDATLN